MGSCGAFCSYCGRCGRSVTKEFGQNVPKNVLPPGVKESKEDTQPTEDDTMREATTSLSLGEDSLESTSKESTHIAQNE